MVKHLYEGNIYKIVIVCLIKHSKNMGTKSSSFALRKFKIGASEFNRFMRLKSLNGHAASHQSSF